MKQDELCLDQNNRGCIHTIDKIGQSLFIPFSSQEINLLRKCFEYCNILCAIKIGAVNAEGSIILELP